MNLTLEVEPFCVVSLVILKNRSFEQLATISTRLSFTRLLDFLGSTCLVKFKFHYLYIATTFVGRLYPFLEQIFEKSQRKSQEKIYDGKLQPSTLVPAQKSFESWLDIG